MMKYSLMLPLLSVAACGQSQPRSIQYFEFNIEEARRTVAECRTGDLGGDECRNADIAIETAESKEKQDRFFRRK